MMIFLVLGVWMYFTKLRKKLRKDETIQIINVRGYGYKLIV